MNKKDEKPVEEAIKSKASSYGRVIKQKRIEDLGADDNVAPPPSKKKSKATTNSHSILANLNKHQEDIPIPEQSQSELWTREDEALLLESMTTKGSYRKTFRDVTFSFTPTLKEIERKWINMLYGDDYIAVSDSGKLATWTNEEIDVLLREGDKEIQDKSDTSNTFHNILSQNTSVFHPSRSASDLESHYNSLKSAPTQINPASLSSSTQALIPATSTPTSTSTTPTPSATTVDNAHNPSPMNTETIAQSPPSQPESHITNGTDNSTTATTSNAPNSPITSNSPPSPPTSPSSPSQTNSSPTTVPFPSDLLTLEPELAEPPPQLREVEAGIEDEKEGDPKLDTDLVSPAQHANRNREYGRIEKLAQREILKVEKEYARDRDSLRERDTKMLATIRGRLVRYSVRTKEVVIGRSTATDLVDIDILEEGPSKPNKCSRRQAIIKMKRDGDFYIKNIGKAPLYINDKEVQQGKKKHLHDNCLIRLCDVYFIFELNKGSLNKIKRQLQV